jgi:hypothetical protein
MNSYDDIDDDLDDDDLEALADKAAEEQKTTVVKSDKEQETATLKFGVKKKERTSGHRKLKKFIKILVFIIIIFLASWWAAYSKVRNAHKRDNTVLNEMEKLYSQGDYAGLADYYFLRVDDLKSKKYAKYKRVSELFDEYVTADAYMREAYDKVIQQNNEQDSQQDDIQDNRQVDYTWEMEQLFRIIMLCDQYRDEGYPYDEGKGVSDIRDMAVNYLMGVLLIQKEDIEMIASKYNEADDPAAVAEVNDEIDKLAIESMNNVLE